MHTDVYTYTQGSFTIQTRAILTESDKLLDESLANLSSYYWSSKIQGPNIIHSDNAVALTIQNQETEIQRDSENTR